MINTPLGAEGPSSITLVEHSRANRACAGRNPSSGDRIVAGHLQVAVLSN
jgi:hypothetical protein